MNPNYSYYKDALAGQPLPSAFVDLDLLNQNISSVLSRVKNQKNIRVATKSIRCRFLLEHILKTNPQLSGLMTFDAREAVFLAQHGFSNILMGYPVTQPKLIDEILTETANGTSICFMIDHPDHVKILQERAKTKNAIASICIDMDMSSSYTGLYFGVKRSSLRNITGLNQLCDIIQQSSHIRCDGLMGYEAQIAGVPDNTRRQLARNKLIQFLKNTSSKEVQLRRQLFKDTLEKRGISLKFVNGGGTGSLEYTSQDPSVTEVTAGSAFFSPHLFDRYRDFKYLPAAAFALEITRKPETGIFTAHGGGYIASGSADPSKLPEPYLPEGAILLPNEGAGEVQTPFAYLGNEPLHIGDLLIMRHAKAGELCERFNQLVMISQGRVIHTEPTYRGEGQCFV